MGVRLKPADVALAGEAMVNAADRADSALPTLGVAFEQWPPRVDPSIADQVATLARHVTAANVLHAAAGATGPVDVEIDRDDLVAALEALADDRDADTDGLAGAPYRALAKRLRGRGRRR